MRNPIPWTPGSKTFARSILLGVSLQKHSKSNTFKVCYNLMISLFDGTGFQQQPKRAWRYELEVMNSKFLNRPESKDLANFFKCKLRSFVAF